MTNRFSSASSIAPIRVAAIRPLRVDDGVSGGVHHALRKPKELPALRVVQARIHELRVHLEGTCLAERHVRVGPRHLWIGRGHGPARGSAAGPAQGAAGGPARALTVGR